MDVWSSNPLFYPAKPPARKVSSRLRHLRSGALYEGLP